MESVDCDLWQKADLSSALDLKTLLSEIALALLDRALVLFGESIRRAQTSKLHVSFARTQFPNPSA